jgi:hypothetical protein
VSLATATNAPPIAQTRPAVLGRQYVVSSCHYLATQAAVRIMQQGGNAIDAVWPGRPSARCRRGWLVTVCSG